MEHPQVAHGGDALQVWRVAVYILNNQPQAADKVWSSSLGVGLTTLQHKKTSLLRKIIRSLGPGGIPWVNNLSERNWIYDLVLGMLEVCIAQVHSGQWRKKSQNI
jgi:hypothetical protein